jgi:diguanylate cyclase (GGDEF)-like protein
MGWAVLAGGLLLTAWAAASQPVPALLPLAVVAVLCLVLESGHLALPYASAVTFGPLVTLPAIIVVGPGYAAACAGLAQYVINLHARRPFPSVIFNAGQRAIGVVIAGAAWNAAETGRLSLAVPQPFLHPDRLLAAAGASVVAYTLATHVMVSVYSAVRRGLPVWRVLIGNAAMRWAATIALGCLGLRTLTVVWRIPIVPQRLTWVLGLPILAGFAYFAYQSYRQSSRETARLYTAVTNLVQASALPQVLERLAALLSREATPTVLWIALRGGTGRFEVAVSRGAGGPALQALADTLVHELWGPEPTAAVRLLRIADHARNRPQPLVVAGDPVRSVMLAPLVAANDLVGAVGLLHPVPDYFIPVQEQAVVALTAQAAFVANYLRIHSESQQNLARAEALQSRNIDLLRESERRAHQLSLLNRAFLRVAASLATEEVFAALVDELHSTLGYPRVALRLIDGGTLRLVANRGVPGPEVHAELPVSRGIIGRVARTGKAALVLDVRRDPDYEVRDPGAHPLVTQQASVPILSGGTVVGVITVQSIEPVLGPVDLELLTTLAGYAALAIGNAQHYEEARTLATTDGLTGLPNRRSLWDAFERELARAIRYGTPLSVIMVEVDRFKHYNDTHGHLRGDDVLRQVSGVLTQEHRVHIDVVARYGGDEFVVLLPQTGKVEAAAIAERIRRTVNGPSNGGPAVTVSCGVAAFPEDGRTIEALMRAADRLMYQAKSAGGDAVAMAPGR